jgi:transposase
MRRLLNQLAHAAVKKDGCYLNVLFHRWLPRMGYKKAIWSIAHRLCRLIWKVLHDEVRYIEKGLEKNPKALKERRRRLVADLQRLGYHVELTPATPSPLPG